MLNVILEANFPLDKTGIQSTASSILKHFPPEQWRLYSSQQVAVAGKQAEPPPEVPQKDQYALIFSHMEYAGLGRLLRHNPHSVAHVGDWPGSYWSSVGRNKNRLLGLAGTVRAWVRMIRVPKSSRLLFVSDGDTLPARRQGFTQAQTLHIGVTPPVTPLAAGFQPQMLCFTGNFRYQPNLEAAKALLAWAKGSPQYQVHLAGFFANDLAPLAGPQTVLHDAVASMPDFLAIHRPVYVSLLRTGAGAKNKILEALTAGCPIIATPESLDETTVSLPCIRQIQSTDDIAPNLSLLQQQMDTAEADTRHWAQEIRASRSWESVARQLDAMLRAPPSGDPAQLMAREA